MIGNFYNISECLAGKIKSFSLFLAVFLLPILTLVSCVDEKIINDDGSKNVYGDEEEISLTFSMYLGQFPTSRADESIDNYIDTETLQVMFFDAEGKFMFKDSNAKVEDSPDKNGQYYVTTSLTNSLKDDSGNSYLSGIRAKMESDNGFKIAVLANWYERADKPYPVNWGWEESVFNNPESCRKIHDLHHLKTDSEYAKYEAYSLVRGEGGLMGLNNSWVQYREVEIGKGYEFTNPEENAWHLEASELNNTTKISSDANTWIRNNWNPVSDKATASSNEHGIYRHYANLWQLWNFGGGYDKNIVSYEDLNASNFKNQWKDRNWTIPQASDNAISLETWVTTDGYVIGNGSTSENAQIDCSIVDGLKVISKSYTDGNDKSNYIRSYNKDFNGKKYCGIILPEMDENAYEGSKSNEETIKISSGYAFEYLNFSVPGTGTLRIIFSSLDQNQATLVVQRGTTFEAKFTAPGKNNLESEPNIKEIGNAKGTVVDLNGDKAGYLVKITEDAEDINLFCLEGNVVIYAIEYICGEYLKATDREGIIPSKNYPIPMYGVEDFPKITGWGASKTLNLSQNGKTIYLIRALAKVEVYLPDGNNTLTHIYMRSMNQKAWCEPMDVETSTYSLWKLHENGLEDNCEWFRIQAHGSGYNGVFNDWFGWFYGSWQSWWDNMNNITISDSQHSPQLFNPDVQRADFCHFIKDENYSDGNLHRYYLYVPDKNISDPGNAGDLFKTPKVPHIEYRYNDNTEYLDDNDCYRVYFTDYSSNEDIKKVKWNGYEDYEKAMGNDGKYNIDQHWPIMRNHIYRFYIGTSNTPQEVRVKVLPWDDEDVKKVEW